MTAIALALGFALCLVLAWAFSLKQREEEAAEIAGRYAAMLDQAQATIEELEDRLDRLRDGALEHNPGPNGADKVH